MRQPGWSRSNRNAVRPLRGSSQVFAIRMKCCAASRAGDEPLAAVHDPAVAAALGASCASSTGRSRRPGAARSSRTRSAPCRRRSARASAPSAPGVPTFSSTIMLPSSGAAELKHDRPEDRRSSSPRSRRPCPTTAGPARRSSFGICERPEARGLRLGAHAARARRRGCSRARRSSRGRLRAARRGRARTRRCADA